MATYNANTVREEARLEELANCVEERGVEILGVQEHRRVHTDQPILYHKVGGCSFITSSAWRNDAQAATGGVGLMVSPRARRALRRVQQHTNRILVADFEGNPVTTVMSVYSPTNAAPIEDVEKFYDELRTAIHHVPAHNFLVILGDFNARLGPEDAPFTYHNNTNRNGEYLSALLTEHELLAANTLFRKRMGKRWTFQDRASGMLRQLDYILAASVGGEICSLGRNDEDDDDKKRRSSFGAKMMGMVGLGKKSQSTSQLNPEGESEPRSSIQRVRLIFPGVKLASDRLFTGFLDGLGPAQLAGRQTLATPSMGDIQIGMVFRKERLDVEVIRARGLVGKQGNKNTPDYGRMDHKSFMGAAQILLDDLDLSIMVIGWFKLFPPTSLVDPALAPLTNSETEGAKA
ncbi:hypothetical protein NHX12_024214 [Muraenolepis orangiensis]|uniref:Endonuclease/exonuclease/phosphatase domain-containing protein n=3 Tax=Muraenolepis orangiensis TaxID=630683 RepID=A0A9Q0ITP2_9TELE|nr:hypothetical protein NHX12_024214 [Muraenolepis orangiensis]